MPCDDDAKDDLPGEVGKESAPRSSAVEESTTPEAVSEELEGGETRAPDRQRGGKELFPPWNFQTYKEAANKYYLDLSDNNMVGGATSQILQPMCL